MDYSALLNKIKTYEKKYVVKEIGKSYFGRKIMAVEMVRNEHCPTAILTASIHARENITSDLISKMLDENLFDEIKDFNISFIILGISLGIRVSPAPQILI